MFSLYLPIYLLVPKVFGLFNDHFLFFFRHREVTLQYLRDRTWVSFLHRGLSENGCPEIKFLKATGFPLKVKVAMSQCVGGICLFLFSTVKPYLSPCSMVTSPLSIMCFHEFSIYSSERLMLSG